MKYNLFNKQTIGISIILTIVWIIFAAIIISSQVHSLTQKKYLDVSISMKEQLQSLIDEKKESLEILSLSIASHFNVNESFVEKGFDLSKLPKISQTLRSKTELNNVWFQVLSTKGVSLYRSWTDKHGDDVSKLRPEVASMISEPKALNVMSVGKFDLTFKSMVPIFHNNDFIGILESLAKFNSVSSKMRAKNLDIIIIVDKKYTPQIKTPFSKKFIENYYIANKNVTEDVFKYVQDKKVSRFLSKKDFYIDKKNNKIYTTFNLQTINKKHLGYIVIFKELDSIDKEFILKAKKDSILFFVIAYFVFFAFFYYFFIKRNQKYIMTINQRLEDKVAIQTKELQSKNETYNYLAHHDSLTGLPNRLLCLERMQSSIEYAKENNTYFSVLFLDLDRFKEVNDTYGHELGDKLLKDVGEKIQTCIRKDDIIARLGGDEFVIIVEDLTNDELVVIIKKIIQVMKEPSIIEENHLYTSFSIGVSHFPIDATNADELLRNADTAMYAAKAKGKNTYAFYTNEMTKKTVQKLELSHNLREAIELESFQTYFQVKVNALTEEIVGVEGLIRWKHQSLGFIAPYIFIPLAEELNLISTIDQWMLAQSTTIIKKWKKAGLDTGKLSLNLSMSQLEDDKFIPYITKFIENADFNPNCLEFEITESQIMHDPELAIKKLESIKKLGVSIAIDDFGTGYSSLSYLKRLPIDTLKIDRSFIKDIPHDSDDMAIVKSIIALAKSLHLNIIAEGVETLEQKNFLLDEGCDVIQGYFYSKPVSEDIYKDILIKSRKTGKYTS